MKNDKLLMFIVMLATILISILGSAAMYKYLSTSDNAEEGRPLFVKNFADETKGMTPFEVNFTSLVFYHEGHTTYHWEFGDGNTSNEANPIHNYTEAGEYTCNLTVTDSIGRKVTNSVTILVVDNKPPTVVALVTPTESPRPHVPGLDSIPWKPPLLYYLVKALEDTDSPLLKKPGWINGVAQVSDPEGDEIISYRWELQQPSVTFLGSQEWPKFYFEGKNLTNITFPQLYTYRMGEYAVKLTVTDSAGNTASDIKKFGVSRSNLMGRRADTIRAWNNFWDVSYYSLPTSLQETLTGTIWSVLGPIQTSMDTTMVKVLSPLPEKVRSMILSLYYMMWEQQEKTYRKPNNPPNTPNNPSPLDSATDVDLDVNLSWDCSDPDGHRLTYDVYFGTTSPPPFVHSGYDATNFELGQLDLDTTYYWKVVAKDSPSTGESKTASGPIWSFTTK